MRERALRLRRALPEDAAFLELLAGHPRVEPFLAPAAARDGATPLERIEHSLADPRRYGSFVLEIAGPEGSERVGGLGFEAWSAQSLTASLLGVMVHPDFRRRGSALAGVRLLTAHLIRDLGFHRVQLECYGFNGAGIRLFERAGFVREGLKRKAYRRHGEWADSVLFAVLDEDLADHRAPPPQQA